MTDDDKPILPLTEEEAAFHREVYEWACVNLPDEIKDRVQRWICHSLPIADLKFWQRKLYENGWAAPDWPAEHGGQGWDTRKTALFRTALRQAGAPQTPPGEGLGQFGPVLAHYGTEQQKRAHLPGILSGDVVWCQGFSEPGAGSDLSALKCRAENCGDHYLISGQKTWTSWAHRSDMMFGLFRTSSGGKPQDGITFLMVDMTSPGLSVKPIKLLNGAPVGFHEVNEVFFDNVRVPVANRVGEEGRGWGLSKILLDYERSSMFMAAELRGRLKQARGMLAQVLEQQGDGAAKHQWALALSQFEIELATLEITEARIRARPSVDPAKAGAEAAYIILRGAELMQSLYEITLELAGVYSAPLSLPREMSLPIPPTPGWAAKAAPEYFRGRVETIYGGSAEVRRNIIARSIL